MTRRRLSSLLCTLVLGACSTVEIVRLQPDLLRTPKGTEPIAGLQATCAGFYLFTVGIPEADLEKAVNELLMKEARKLGAHKVVQLRFDVTPSHGLWFLTKLFWVRSATAWGVAVVKIPGAEDGADDGEPGDEEDGAAARGGATKPAKARGAQPLAPTTQPGAQPPSSRPAGAGLPASEAL